MLTFALGADTAAGDTLGTVSVVDMSGGATDSRRTAPCVTELAVEMELEDEVVTLDGDIGRYEPSVMVFPGRGLDNNEKSDDLEA